MSDFVILVPVLARPQNAAALVRNIRQVSEEEHRIIFLCSPDDTAQQRACVATGAETVVVPWTPGRADWARKLEHGRHISTEPYMVLAADDLRFYERWDVNARYVFDKRDVGVLGTQDKGNPLVKRGLHSTHPIVCRGYADMYGTIDRPDLMISQAYDHQYCDNELCETAMARDCWHFARAVIIEHLHPAWGKAQRDRTYVKATRQTKEDYRLFVRRRRMWRRGSSTRSRVSARTARHAATSSRSTGTSSDGTAQSSLRPDRPPGMEAS